MGRQSRNSLGKVVRFLFLGIMGKSEKGKPEPEHDDTSNFPSVLPSSSFVLQNRYNYVIESDWRWRGLIIRSKECSLDDLWSCNL